MDVGNVLFAGALNDSPSLGIKKEAYASFLEIQYSQNSIWLSNS